MTTPRILRCPEVLLRTGLGKSTLYRRVAQGQFPKPIPLGSAHSVGWVAEEVDRWIDAQIRAARPEPDTGALPPAA
jgi:prophage regulatory protein